MQLYRPVSTLCLFSSLLLGTLLCLSGCLGRPLIVEAPPPYQGPLPAAAAAPGGKEAKANQEWAGTYQAILPCNGCPGVAISVQLRTDHTALVRERRLGEPHGGRIEPSFWGRFHFSPANSSLIALIDPAATLPAYQFFVGQDWIELRDRRTGAALTHTTTYRLQKTSIDH